MLAVGARAGTNVELARDICVKQLVGIAGVAAERIQHVVLNLPGGVEAALRTLELHPMFNPAVYVDADVSPDTADVRRSPAHEDGAWIALTGPAERRPLQERRSKLVFSAYLDVGRRRQAHGSGWARIFAADTAAEELPEVAVVKFSRGASWEFENRRSLPLTVVDGRQRSSPGTASPTQRRR